MCNITLTSERYKNNLSLLMIMKNFNWKKHLVECMDSTLFCALSTIENGRTWTCPVLFAYDEKFNLYFISMLSSKHMQNIEKDGQVSVAIYSTKFGVDDDVFGIQIVGKAKVLPKNEVERAYEIYHKRKFPEANLLKQQLHKTMLKLMEKWKFVKIAPVEIHYFDTRFFDEERQIVPEEVYK